MTINRHDPDNYGYEHDLIYKLEVTIGKYDQDRDEALRKLEPQFSEADILAELVLDSSKSLLSIKKLMKDDIELPMKDIYLPNFLKDIELPNLHKHLTEISEIFPPEDFEFLISSSDENGELPRHGEEKDLNLRRIIAERFYINLSNEAVSMADDATDRIFKLYKLILETAPSEPTLKFLSRLSRCYIWGFDPECVILCRAVIDTAFRECINDVICEKHLGPRNTEFALIDRILVASKEKIIDQSIKEKAEQVRLRGNKAVHYQPDITKEVFETICDTMQILQVLCNTKRV